MKFLSLKLLLPCVVLAVFGIGINAQPSCTLPGPANLHVVSVTTNSAEIGWTEVPGAADYKIETVDVLSGTTVSTLYTIDNTIVIPGLLPSRAYDITVTSRCDNGFDGGHSIIRVNTGIVVVDVILELCVPGTGTYTSDPDTHLPGSTSSYGIYTGEVLGLSGENFGPPSGGDNNGPFELQFEIRPGTNNFPELVMNTTADYDTRMRLTPSNIGNNLPAKIEYRGDTNSASWDILGYVMVAFSNHPTIYIDWSTEVDIVHTYCGGSGNGGGKGNKENDDDGNDDDGESNDSNLEVSPNPTHGWFVMTSPDEETVATITDLYGQSYYEAELYPGEPHEVDAYDWPNGTYIIHTIEGGEPRQTMVIKQE